MERPNHSVRWWHCWLTHAWGRWSEPKQGVWSSFMLGGHNKKVRCLIQERRCEACGRIELRDIG